MGLERSYHNFKTLYKVAATAGGGKVKEIIRTKYKFALPQKILVGLVRGPPGFALSTV